MGLVRRVFDLQFLAASLGKRLVIGDLGNNRRDLRTKLLYELFVGRLGIFDRVMQDSCLQDNNVADAAGRREQMGKRDRVVDVWRCGLVLSALVKNEQFLLKYFCLINCLYLVTQSKASPAVKKKDDVSSADVSYSRTH